MSRFSPAARRMSVAMSFAAALTMTAVAAARADVLSTDMIAAPDQAVVAQSQATPTPKTGTQPSPGTGKGTPRNGVRPRKFEHWELTPTAYFTFSSGTDLVPPGGGVNNIGTPPGNTEPLDTFRITGTARYRFNNHLSARFQRIEHTGATGRVYRNGKTAFYGGHSEDYEERFLAEWTWNPYLVSTAGYAMRTRTCCPAAAQANPNPRIKTGFFTDETWRFGPNTIGGKPWTFNFRWEQQPHHPNNISLGKPNPLDQGVKPTFATSLYSNVYLWHQTKVVPYYGLEYFSTYFSYSPAMTITYRKVYGVAYRATSDISWRAYVKIDQSGGILATDPNGAHKSTAFLEGTYRLHW